jgi:hypothetical protein
MSLLSSSFCFNRLNVADPIVELLAMFLCSEKTIFLKLIPADGRMTGCDWENVAPHALFSSNLTFVKSEFPPGGPQMVGDALSIGWGEGTYTWYS